MVNGDPDITIIIFHPITHASSTSDKHFCSVSLQMAMPWPGSMQTHPTGLGRAKHWEQLLIVLCDPVSSEHWFFKNALSSVPSPAGKAGFFSAEVHWRQRPVPSQSRHAS
jgi:hypothetical protein